MEEPTVGLVGVDNIVSVEVLDAGGGKVVEAAGAGGTRLIVTEDVDGVQPELAGASMQVTRCSSRASWLFTLQPLRAKRQCEHTAIANEHLVIANAGYAATHHAGQSKKLITSCWPSPRRLGMRTVSREVEVVGGNVEADDAGSFDEAEAVGGPGEAECVRAADVVEEAGRAEEAVAPASRGLRIFW